MLCLGIITLFFFLSFDSKYVCDSEYVIYFSQRYLGYCVVIFVGVIFKYNQVVISHSCVMLCYVML